MDFLPAALLDPATVWGLLLRGLGLIYFIAIVQLYHQVLPLAGSMGASPIGPKLAQIRLDYPGWRKWLYFPTLLWLDHSDRFLKGLVVLGSVSALVVMYGGPFAGLALLVCWLVYLSFDLPLSLSYPWDSVLLEAGFLALFLPELHHFPDVSVTVLPHPLVAWGFRLLMFRLIFGFGKFKFWKSNLRDTGYFRAFMVNIPLPAYPAWYLYRLPGWFFQAILTFSFVVEVIAPFFIFSSSELRLVAALLISLLMVGIQGISNFGFFNILTIVLCLPLLDVQSSIFDLQAQDLYATPGHVLTSVVMLVLVTGGFLNFFFNTWCTFTWMHWPTALFIKSRFMAGLLSFYRVLVRFRVTHSYGVFPSYSSPPIKLVPVIEGSRDGVTWEPYEYQYITTSESTPPRFVAPYHPRWDHAIFYDAFGTNDANYMWGVVGTGNPYDFTHASSLEGVLQKVLEGNREVYKIFRKVPFPASEPPQSVRVMLYRFQPTTPAERRSTGQWWVKQVAGLHLSPRSLDTDMQKKRSTQPELFHFDAVYWRRWSPRMQELDRIGRAALPELVQATAEEGLSLSADYFWNKFLPGLRSDGRSWEELPEVVEQLKEEYSFDQLRNLEIFWNQLVLMLAARLELYYLGQQEPQLKIETYFHFGLFLNHVVGKGRETYEQVLLHPEVALDHLADFTPQDGFYFNAIFRFDTQVFHARKLRWLRQVQPDYTEEVIPGFVRLIPFLSEQFRGMGEENWPRMHRQPDNGEWVIEEPIDQRTYV
ncbi:lipase maturation factor family protein [Telluribacter humicola]|uniref:lipase maturation factor family protein n=1 Tax=Telluribacter humicola TaxID=1720261 RepID=UPI001A977481|nr:lipase maturation factor family protein [Telluribacter humicola]